MTLLSTLLFSFDSAEDCELMNNNAAYGVMHSKKAFKARNYDDQKYFAKKALDAYHHVLENLNNCACGILTEKVEGSIDNLESTKDTYDWYKESITTEKKYT